MARRRLRPAAEPQPRPAAERRLWPAAERLLDGLPPHLREQATLARYDLALRHAPTGRFTDIFTGTASFPILSIGSWLLDDLGGVGSAQRVSVETHLFVASVLLALRTHVTAAIDDPSSFADEASAALAAFCSERSILELIQALPSDSPFWHQQAAISLDDLEAGLAQRDDRAGAAPSDPVVHLRSRWSAPGRIVASAALAVAGRPEIVPLVHAMLDDLATALQVEADLASMHHDLLVGRITYPIAVVAHDAGIELHPIPRAERVLGALVLTGSLAAILATAVARLDAARETASRLGLAAFTGFIEAVGRRLDDRLQATSAGPDGTGATAARATAARATDAALIRIADPTVPRALAMARASLTADPSLRESWETHREGMLGADEVASRFPAGLILAWLSEDGLELARPVDDFLAFTAANRFRYYDHPWSGVDADTIGISLRLLRHAADPLRHRPAIEAVLSCLGRQVRREGSVPVWITDCDPPSDAPPDILALGEGCATVVAHLLLGLLDAPVPVARGTLEIGSTALLDRVGSGGLAANVNYPPAYALGVLFRLLAGLDSASLGSHVVEKLPAARQALDAELDRVLRIVPRSAQEAALATLACREAGALDRVDPRWLARILTQQRSDGGWPAERFAAAPNRGGWVSWYSSSTLTTALCHSALTVHAGASAPASRSG